MYFISGKYGNQEANSFNQRHEDMHVSRKYLLKLVAKIRETGPVTNKKSIFTRPVRNKVM